MAWVPFIRSLARLLAHSRRHRRHSMHSHEWVRKHTTTWQQSKWTRKQQLLYVLYINHSSVSRICTTPYRLLCTDMSANAPNERGRANEEKKAYGQGRQGDDGMVFIDYFVGYTHTHIHRHTRSVSCMDRTKWVIWRACCQSVVDKKYVVLLLLLPRRRRLHLARDKSIMHNVVASPYENNRMEYNV